MYYFKRNLLVSLELSLKLKRFPSFSIKMLGKWLKVFEPQIKYLKISGINIDSSSANDHKVISFLLAFTHTFLLDFYMIVAIIAYLLNVQSLESFSEAIGILPTLIGAFFKTLNFIYFQKQIKMFIKSLQSLIEFESWIEEGKGEKLRSRISQMNKLFKIFMTMAVIGCFFACLVPFSTHEVPHKMWFPYNYKSSELSFWLSVSYQLIGSSIFTPVVIIIDTFPAFLLSYITGMIEELAERLQSITTKRGENKSMRDGANLTELLKCVEIQSRLKQLRDEVGNIFGAIIWAQGFMSTVILCTTSFSLSVVSQITKISISAPTNNKSRRSRNHQCSEDICLICCR